ncbi:MAG: restriction endonuclease [Peptococcaceae bacterium BRH_c4b]|nr:MAG: restriction endonuclease [Peptococcaceae bacterium BRH_c4b]
MKADELKQFFSNISTWKRNGERAPHKPLILLYALGRLDRKEPRLVSYKDVKEKLKHLLVEFGPQRRTTPRYPFLRLSNDRIWELSGKNEIDPKRDWSDQVLLNNDTHGGFTEEIYSMLSKDRKLTRELANILLEQNFPETIHEDVLSEVGLDMELAGKLRRDPQFRERVLKAYEYRCAVCGFNVQLGNILIALEAAHIKWHQAGGPDQEENGIALCTMHHKLFDRGVFTLSKSLKFQVAEAAHGTEGFEEWLMRYHGKQIRHPQSPLYKPKDSYIKWHMREVFRGPERYIAD